MIAGRHTGAAALHLMRELAADGGRNKPTLEKPASGVALNLRQSGDTWPPGHWHFDPSRAIEGLLTTTSVWVITLHTRFGYLTDPLSGAPPTHL
jgi:hypothetical protein